MFSGRLSRSPSACAMTDPVLLFDVQRRVTRFRTALFTTVDFTEDNLTETPN